MQFHGTIAAIALLAATPLVRGTQPTVALNPLHASQDPSFVIPPLAEEGAWSVNDLMNAYGDHLMMALVADAETMAMMKSDKVGMRHAWPVAAAEAQETVEGLLSLHGFCLYESGAEAAPFLVVASIRSNASRSLRTNAILVPEAELGMYKHRPATLIQTVLTLKNTDVRQLSNSLRALLTDANLQQMIPAGNSNCMIVTGLGHYVYAMAESLRLIDENSEPQAPQAEAQADQED